VVSQKGETLGTPEYMAPEQIRGDVEAIGPGCDIYSMGVLLYELLTGKRPFEGPLVALVYQILKDVPPPPSSRCSGLDPALDAVCLKAMAKEVSARFGTMSEFATALEEFLQHSEAAAAVAAEERRRTAEEARVREAVQRERQEAEARLEAEVQAAREATAEEVRRRTEEESRLVREAFQPRGASRRRRAAVPRRRSASAKPCSANAGKARPGSTPNCRPCARNPRRKRGGAPRTKSAASATPSSASSRKRSGACGKPCSASARRKSGVSAKPLQRERQEAQARHEGELKTQRAAAAEEARRRAQEEERHVREAVQREHKEAEARLEAERVRAEAARKESEGLVAAERLLRENLARGSIMTPSRGSSRSATSLKRPRRNISKRCARNWRQPGRKRSPGPRRSTPHGSRPKRRRPRCATRSSTARKSWPARRRPAGAWPPAARPPRPTSSGSKRRCGTCSRGPST